MLVDDGVRLPGVRREALLSAAQANGLEVDAKVLNSFAAPTRSV